MWILRRWWLARRGHVADLHAPIGDIAEPACVGQLQGVTVASLGLDEVT